MASADSLSHLRTIQHHVDDIRNLTLCKVCLRPFYEPFILGCGHTFCYGCLRSWFCGDANRRKKKNCPECRTAIHTTPAPNFSMRDLAHIFLDRPELLPEDETIEEHRRGRTEEANILAEDRRGRGLFQGIFDKYTPGVHLRTIRDAEDGVDRCPSCNWEIEEDGLCYQCGWRDVDFSDEDGSMDENSSIMENVDGYYTDLEGGGSIDGGIEHYYDIQPNDDDTAEGTDDYNAGDPSSDVDVHNYDEYDDDMHDMNSDDEDQPNEIDYDTYDFEQPRARVRTAPNMNPYLNTGGYQPFSGSDYGENSSTNDYNRPQTISSDGEEDDEDGIVPPHRRPGHNMSSIAQSLIRHTRNPTDVEDDEQTNYDESSDDGSPPMIQASRPAQPVRRTHIIISDDEESETEHNPVPAQVNDEGAADNPAEVSVDDSGASESETAQSDSDSEVDDDTDDSTPPQSAVNRRHRLQAHRHAQARRSNSSSNEQQNASRMRGSGTRLPGSSRTQAPVDNTSHHVARSGARGGVRTSDTTGARPRPTAQVH